MNCPHCSKAVFRLSADGGKIKAITNCLVLHKSGDVEINCGHCKRGLIVPLMPQPGESKLRKARDPIRLRKERSTQ